MKDLSFLDMKQQNILKLILLRVSFFSVQVSFDEYIACLPSSFGNSKMVTECQPRPISINFGSPSRGRGFMCGRHGAGLDWPEEKYNLNFSNNILLIFAAIKI